MNTASAHDLLENVHDEATFLDFIRALRRECVDAPDGWQNDTIEQFLESAAAWANDTRFGETVGVNAAAPVWRKFAAFLYAGKVYE